MKKSYSCDVMASIIIASALVLTSCENNTPEKITPVKKEIITGKVQKGPFVEGSSVRIFSLDKDFSQNGNAFLTSIIDKQGSFEQRDMQLASQFVELLASGYYFNEVNGELSTSPLTLSAIADISSADNVNVNILTTLERERILFLVGKGSGFSNAKEQAHREVLAIFGMTPREVDDAVNLNVEQDAQMLAISAIVQGVRSTAEVTQLIANIASDIREDGSLDDTRTASVLKNNAMGLKPDELVANMANYDLA